VETGYAYIYLPGELEPSRLGVLELIQEPRSLTGSFTYSSEFLEHPKRFEIDPRLPLGSATHLFGPDEPIFGVFEDASPDAWGRYVIENKLRKLEASAMEYLVHASLNRIGSVVVVAEPHLRGEFPRRQVKDLPTLLSIAERIERGDPLSPEERRLIDPGPSAGGARPKDTLFHEGREWIAKFPSRDDRIDIGKLELATLAMARAAGLDTPDFELITVAGKSVLLVERFDREPAEGSFVRRHFMSALTACGMGVADSRHLSYPQLAELLRLKGGDAFRDDNRQLFRRMVFNLFVGNDDDHGKNHGFLVDGRGRLKLSPVYDIVPKARVGETFVLAIGLGEDGRTASVANALSRCEVFGIERAQGIEIMEEVRGIVAGFRKHLQDARLDEASIDRISRAFLAAEIDHGLPADAPPMSVNRPLTSP
jgi:serine/threonine-protein kinase HipA